MARVVTRREFLNLGVQPEAPRLAGMEAWYLKRQPENFRAEVRGVNPADIEGVAMQPMAAGCLPWSTHWSMQRES